MNEFKDYMKCKRESFADILATAAASEVRKITWIFVTRFKKNIFISFRENA